MLGRKGWERDGMQTTHAVAMKCAALGEIHPARSPPSSTSADADTQASASSSCLRARAALSSFSRDSQAACLTRRHFRGESEPAAHEWAQNAGCRLTRR